MKTILVYVETRGEEVVPTSLELLAAAGSIAVTLGARVEALVCAPNASAIASKLVGSHLTLAISHAALGPYSAEAHACCVREVVAARKPDLVLFSYSSIGIDLSPVAAAARQAELATGVKAIEAEANSLLVTSQIYGGKLSAKLRLSLPAVAMVVPGAFDVAASGVTGEVESVPLPASLSALRSKVLSESPPPTGGVDLTQSAKIFCVGRGIGSEGKIAAAKEVADLLGAALAGSRPVIDNGWLPKVHQVGKSGTKVKPKLYVAAGVSGAPEHLEGMAASELIVAINSDAAAPIFGVAHFGATCDLFDFLDAVKERLGDGG